MHLDCIDSTNEEAKRRAVAGAAAGTLITALSQTSGRGRQGRQWVSPPGNCYSSLILRPNIPPAEAAKLSFLAAVVVAETIESAISKDWAVRCKWPNDVLIDGAKSAGILLESHMGVDGKLDWLIIGVGINIEHCPPDTPYPATTIRQKGGTADTDGLVKEYAARMVSWLDIWQDKGFTPVRDAWLIRANGLGEPIRVQTGADSVTGIFLALDESGALVLQLKNGDTKKITAGDVYPVA